MMTLYEIERRHDEIKQRLSEIWQDIRSKTGDPSDLAEEVAKLTFEMKTLSANIRFHREMAEVLAESDCAGGPH